MRRHALTIVSLIFGLATPAAAVDETVLNVAKSILSQLQDVSVRKNSEYCGMLFRRDDGTLMSTVAYKGTHSRCRVRRIPQEGTIVASFHTHGSYLKGFDNEVPSPLDLQVEMEWQIDGFVSTPGGRFWHIDGRRGIVNLVCGPGCMPSDPNYLDDTAAYGKIQTRYTQRELIQRSYFNR